MEASLLALTADSLSSPDVLIAKMGFEDESVVAIPCKRL